jgi:ElaB/YqjD/DUF883 family membrane-anchored ribosome-binding protein
MPPQRHVNLKEIVMQNTGMQGSTSGATGVGRLAEDLAERAPAALSRLTDTAQHTMERVTQAASQAASRLGERSDELLALQGRALEHARSYVREHPVATVAIALAIGLLISRLTARR